MAALTAFAVPVVEEMFVVVFVITVHGHSDQTDQRIEIDGGIAFTGRILRSTDRASGEN